MHVIARAPGTLPDPTVRMYIYRVVRFAIIVVVVGAIGVVVATVVVVAVSVVVHV